MKKLLLTLAVLSVSLCSNGLAYAQGFTNESFQGNYAFTGSVGKGVGLGVGIADGNGTISGSVIQRFWNRKRFEVAMDGTYTVNEDGTGRMTFNVSDEADESADLGADFVITRAEVIDGVKLATEIFVVQDNGFLGSPATITGTRLPD